MPAQRAYKHRSAPWRNDAYAAININWKQISRDGTRDERLAWISEFLGHEVTSLTDLTDDQLGAVAGEMKRRCGRSADAPVRIAGSSGETTPRRESDAPNIVHAQFGTPEEPAWRAGATAAPVESEVVHLASPEQVHTLRKLTFHLCWSMPDVIAFIKSRVLRGNARSSEAALRLQMLTFHQATRATNALLHVAAHRDLKKRNGEGRPVSRTAINNYIPTLKEHLGIDQKR